MSKSLGNFFTLRDLMEKGYSPEVVRYLFVTVPYRKKLNFTFEGLKAAATSIERLRNYKLRLETEKFASGSNPKMSERIQAAASAFDVSLDDDLNTAEALASAFELIRETNTAMDNGEFLAANAQEAIVFLARFDSIFDVLKPSVVNGAISDEEIEALISERVLAKKSKDYKRSDEIRASLLEKGIVLEDTKEGARWKRK